MKRQKTRKLKGRKRKKTKYEKSLPLEDTQSQEDKKNEEQSAETSSEEEEGDVNPYSELLMTIASNKSASNVVDVDGSEEENDAVLHQTIQNQTRKKDSKNTIEKDEEQNSEKEEEDISEEDEKSSEKDDECFSESEDCALSEHDPFSLHCEGILEEEVINQLEKPAAWNKTSLKLPGLGNCSYQSVNKENFIGNHKEKDLKKMHVKFKLCDQVLEATKEICTSDEKKERSGNGLDEFQLQLFRILNSYQDIYYPNRDSVQGEKIRLTYCLHALNHVLKTRSRIIAHNTKLKNRSEPSDEEYRDQGLTRPKVLIVLPFKECALRVVKMFQSLITSKDKVVVGNKNRFFEEYREDPAETKPVKKPPDFEELFAGNIDDHFRIGIALSRGTIKLYSKFYDSDIILASPLGLRMIIGAEGDKERDYDFLNSIEMLILDQADVFMMQNWDHILHLMQHLHLQPKDSHGVDFSRVRMWNISGWSKYYRQTMMFSSVAHPQLTSLFNKHCHNYAGKLSVLPNDTDGTICQIAAQLPQMFHRINPSTYQESFNARFDFFVKKVLPRHKNSVMQGTLIFIPSYFDYVRIRNFFAKEDMDFVHINEYSKDKNITKARSNFFHRKAHFMLYTERCHFYKRFRLRGIRHIVFYELPTYGHFYSELCNMLQDRDSTTDSDKTCTVLYTIYDAQRLAAIVGTSRASVMINADKNVHMFMTGEKT